MTVNNNCNYFCRFETNIERYTVDVGDTINLRTNIGGYPLPNVEWYFGEQKLEQSEQIEVKFVNGLATLTIKNVEKINEGVYYCHAENDQGKAVLSCNLRVTDAKSEPSESTHKLSHPPSIYYLSDIKSKGEAEVFYNVHVTHTAESYRHHFAAIQPETIALGYSCFASTSKICDDSVIITHEKMQKLMEEMKEEVEVHTTLNVNVEKAPEQFTHDAHILQPFDQNVVIFGRESKHTKTEEIMQPNNIVLIEEQRVLHESQYTENAVRTVVLEKPSQHVTLEVICLCEEKKNVCKKMQAVSTVDLEKAEMVNELMNTFMATKTMRKAYAEANVDVRRPHAIYDHITTIVESHIIHLNAQFVEPMSIIEQLPRMDFHLQKIQESLKVESRIVEYSRRRGTAEQRIVILESLPQKFHDAIKLSLKKIHARIV
ncbi:unnamed protein product [Thelazia callipaeda]|uniref:Ig-like domain-containing protein n=1 Tax=Thelazia callipaeda TaxID=103827 RepID=A0A0N5CT41_THECL|nr:unnamed protein product [Thelazia callipaeda]